MATEIRTEQSIFGTPRETGFGYSNVADTFRRTSGQGVVDYIGEVYGARVAHIPDTTERVGVIVTNPGPRIDGQLQYLSAILRQNLMIQPHHQLNGQYEGTLVVPFINVSATERQLQDHGMHVWGLPGRLVDVFKNKADCHEEIERQGIPGFEVAPHQIFHVDEVAQRSLPYFASIKRGYEEVGMSHYPAGIILRAAESDGGYGGCFVKEVENEFILVKDGNSSDTQRYKSAEEAFANAQKHLGETGNEKKTVEPRVVASRLMQLADSPGLSVVILDGRMYSLGWNDQVQESGNSACTGTKTYAPETDTLRRIKEENEERTTLAFENFIVASAKYRGVDLSHVNGVANVDLMIPGPMEVEFQRRLGRQAGIKVAEINPRFTNWTDALLLVAGANGWTRSIANMHRAIDEGVLTEDKFHFRKGADLEAARELIFEADQRLAQQGTRLLARMLDYNHFTMGVVYAGDIQQAQTQLQTIAQRV